MGRTNPTYRNLLDGIETRWGPYRRGLRRDDQRRFDQLFEHARAHADAAGNVNHLEPFYPLTLSILLAHERLLEERARSIEANATTLEARAQSTETLEVRAQSTEAFETRLETLEAQLDELESRLVSLEGRPDAPGED